VRWGYSIAMLVLTAAYALAAHADERTDRVRAELLEQMRALASQTKVSFQEGNKSAELQTSPVFRYDDQPRRFIDATMWMWTVQGRPVAFQKIEAVEYGDTQAPSPLWQYCFASMSPALANVEWPGDRRFRAKEAGIEVRPLAGAPSPAAGSLQRKRQGRDLARKFSGRIITSPKANTRQEMRLLTTPLVEFDDPHSQEYQGAVFGFATNGTNPDVLLLLEIGDAGKNSPAQWHFAPVRMTCCEVRLAYGDTEAWRVDWVNGTEAPFPTWTFFSTPRAPLTAEAPR